MTAGTGPMTTIDSSTSEMLDTWITDARQRYVDANPTSASWATRAVDVLPGGNTRSVLHFEPFPFRVASATGQHLVDVDGHRYLDLLGNYTAGLLGHSPEPVRAAAHAAIDGGWALGAVHPNEVRLAESIVGRFASIDQVRFTNSGTEANLMALALATNHTGRDRVVVFEGGYHGGVITFGGARDVNVPHDWIVSTYNDTDALDAVFAEQGDSIAAVLVEPLQGSAGCIPGTHEFLAALRTHCDAVGAVLIFDEVMTSRLGPGGAQELFDVTPDMTTLGKYLAGGFTFGAFGGHRELMSAFGPDGNLGHAGTFNNNVVSMAAGVATLGDILTPEVLAATNARGERLRSALNDVFARHRLPMCASGAGSLMNLHGTAGPVTSIDDLHGADDRWKELLFFDALDAGFYIARRGFVALSIEITDDDVDAFADRWAAAITPGP